MEVSGILSQIRTGGFVNPISSQMNKALFSLTPKSLDDFTALAQSQADLSGLTMPDSGQLQSAVNSINTAFKATQGMLAHSNKLSGVDMSSDVFHVVARTVNAAKTVTGEKSCDSVLAAFGALQNAANILTDTISTIKQLESFLLNIPNSVNQIPKILESYANRLVAQVIADGEVLIQARLLLMQKAMAESLVSLIGDECLGAVLAGIMTEPLKAEVQSAATKLLSKKQINITK